MTEASWINTPAPLLELVSVDPASRSSPAFEFTDTPATGCPDVDLPAERNLVDRINHVLRSNLVLQARFRP